MSLMQAPRPVKGTLGKRFGVLMSGAPAVPRVSRGARPCAPTALRWARHLILIMTGVLETAAPFPLVTINRPGNLRGFRCLTIRLPLGVSRSRTRLVSPGWRLALTEANLISLCLVADTAESRSRLRIPARTNIPTWLVHRIPVDGVN